MVEISYRRHRFPPMIIQHAVWLKKQGFAPKLLVTDNLRSYACGFRRLRLTCPFERTRYDRQRGRHFDRLQP